jgi:hypothetical protein
LLVVCVLALSGCTQSAPQDKNPQAGPSVITAPGDLLNDTGAHIHDYWRGANRLVVLDSTHPGGDRPGTGPGFANGRDIVVRSFQPASGDVVPQGTSAVEITVSWKNADLDSYTNPTLWFKSAAENASTSKGAVKSGEAIVVNVTANDADLPHQMLSAWLFELRMASPDPMPLRFKGSVTMKVEAIRGLPLPVFPPHPDLWKGESELPLMEGSGSLSYFEDLTDGGCNGAACPKIFRPAPGFLVPHNASRVRVDLEANGNVDFFYRDGRSREFKGENVVASASPGISKRTIMIPVDGGGDGPYAKQSLWEFTVRAQQPPAVSGVRAAVDVDYSFTATVLRDTP